MQKICNINLLLFNIFLPLSILAQAQIKQTLVEMKNGSQIRGKLIEQAEQIKIQTQDGNIWVLEAKEVVNLSKVFNPNFIKEKGFINMTEFGILSGANDEQGANPQRYASFSFRTFNGYQPASGFAIGLTTGADWYNNAILSPIAVGIRGDFARTRITPFYQFDIGGSFVWQAEQDEIETAKGGFLLNTGLGLKVRLPSQAALTVGLSYQFQKFETRFQEFTWGGNWVETVERREYNRIALRLGFGF